MNEESILRAFDSLIASGVARYDNGQRTIAVTDQGLQIQFVVTPVLAQKPTLQKDQAEAAARATANGGASRAKTVDNGESDIDTRGFEIGKVGSTHDLVANKFCVGRPHLLLLTADGSRRQYEALDRADLTAAWSALTAVGKDYFVFFNGGQDAGCSRLHKHMQLMPYVPGHLASFLDRDGEEAPDAVPFHWFYERLDPSTTTPLGLCAVYARLLEKATAVGQGLGENAASAPPGAVCPHSMIFTRRWMLVIPRRRAIANGAAGNAMGMIGIVWVSQTSEMDLWLGQGPLQVLRELGVPK